MFPAPQAAALFPFSCWKFQGPERFEAACAFVWSQWSLICATAFTQACVAHSLQSQKARMHVRALTHLQRFPETH